MVLVGHSMGGVIARLMISSSGDHLVDTLLATAQMTPAQRELLRTKGAPVLTFLPEPEVSRVVFIATPHRGTDVAGTRLGRWIGRLVRLPRPCWKTSPPLPTMARSTAMTASTATR